MKVQIRNSMLREKSPATMYG